MKADLITLLVSLAVAVAAWFARGASYFTTVHGRYYFAAVFLTSGILALIALLRLIRQPWSHAADAVHPHAGEAAEHRQVYRIRYDQPPHPVFIQKEGDAQSAPVFSCPVLDVSETGIRLGCCDVYAPGQTVQGEIIFDSGRSASINGVVVRMTAEMTVLQLHCTIAPPLLMAEQRAAITIQKNEGPRPAVSPALKQDLNGSLPSHQPKGLCRLKRP